MSQLSSDELALRMPKDWNLPDAPKILGMSGGVSACLLNGRPGEIGTPATDNHILSYIAVGEKHHRRWVDGKLILDGALPSRSINMVLAGGAPAAVISSPIRVLHVYLPHRHLLDLANSIGGFRTAGAIELIDPRHAPDPELITLLSLLHDLVDARSPVDRLWRDSICAAISARVLQRWSNIAGVAASRRESRSVGLAPWQLARVIEILKANLSDEPSLAELATAVNLSLFHFARSFKVATGVPPHRYLLDLRVERARELLETTDLPVTAIAAQIGYEDPGYFARMFKRALGITPMAYRRERDS